MQYKIAFAFWLVVLLVFLIGLFGWAYLSAGMLYTLALALAVAFVAWVATRDYMGTGR